MEATVFAVDLREKREGRDMSREELAVKIGTSAHHIYRIESRRRSISFPLAMACSSEFDGLTLEFEDGKRFALTPMGSSDDESGDHIPDDEELHDLSDAEHTLNVMQQAEDVVSVMQRITSSPLLMRTDSELSDSLRVTKYKELFELDWALHGRFREGMQLHPHLVEEGKRRALAERPRCTKEAHDVVAVA